VVYCFGVKPGASVKADWFDFSIADKHGRIASVRWFSPDSDSKKQEFGNKYLIGHLTLTQHGYQTDYMEIHNVETLGRNPEIDLAIDYLKTVVTDTAVLDFVEKTNFYNTLANYANEDFPEPGCQMLKLAHEVCLARTFGDLSPLLDSGLIIKGLYMQYAHVTAGDPTKQIWSNTLLNFLMTSRYEIFKDRRVFALLDVESPKLLPEKEALESIRQVSLQLFQMRKAVNKYTFANNKIWGSN
jgi:hypothetical protein